MASHGRAVGSDPPNQRRREKSAGRNGTSSRAPGPTGSARVFRPAQDAMSALGKLAPTSQRGGAMRSERRDRKEGQLAYQGIVVVLPPRAMLKPDGLVRCQEEEPDED